MTVLVMRVTQTVMVQNWVLAMQISSWWWMMVWSWGLCMHEMLQNCKTGLWRAATQSVKGQRMVCSRIEQSSQSGPQDEGRLEQSGLIAGTQTQTAFLSWAGLVYQKAIWPACIPAASLSTRHLLVQQLMGVLGQTFACSDFKEHCKECKEVVGHVNQRKLIFRSLIYTCALDTDHVGWEIDAQATGCKTSYTDSALCPFQPYQTGSSSYLCPRCLAWKRVTQPVERWLRTQSCSASSSSSSSPAQICWLNKD